MTASFKTLYVFVVIEHATGRLLHANVTTNANRTLQQLREVVGDAEAHAYLIHDRDNIFSKALDDSVKPLGLKVLRTPVASPRANSICERVIGTIHGECLDWMIPVSEKHLRAILSEWVAHYNGARVHKALGPSVIGSDREVRIPASIGGRHARACETGAVRIAS